MRKYPISHFDLRIIFQWFKVLMDVMETEVILAPLAQQDLVALMALMDKMAVLEAREPQVPRVALAPLVSLVPLAPGETLAHQDALVPLVLEVLVVIVVPLELLEHLEAMAGLEQQDVLVLQDPGETLVSEWPL